MIGEIGGDAEEEAALYIQKNVTKPIAAFIAGRTAPPGKRMGACRRHHIPRPRHRRIQNEALERAGVKVAPNPAEMGETLQQVLKNK